MGAKYDAKRSAVWTKEFAGILLDGIEDNDEGKLLAKERLKRLHPLHTGGTATQRL